MKVPKKMPRRMSRALSVVAENDSVQLSMSTRFVFSMQI